MAPEIQTFETKDGKLIKYDAQAGTVKVSTPEYGTADQLTAEFVAFLKNVLPGVQIVDFKLLSAGQSSATQPGPAQTGQIAKDKADPVLGSIDYYILVPDKYESFIYKGPIPITSWTTEYKDGHHPEYKDHKKHRVMPEQFDWLKQHKDCQIVAWYSPECPLFASLGCQTHAKVIQPVIPQNIETGASKDPQFVKESPVLTQHESIIAEDREV